MGKKIGIKINKRKRALSLAKTILKSLAIIAVLPTATADILTPRGMKMKRYYLYKKTSRELGYDVPKKLFYDTVKRLERRELITIKEEVSGDQMIMITKKGRKKVLRYNLDEMKIPKPKKWDGWWRVIIYDIPVRKRVKRRREEKESRDALRTKLKELGFYHLQKSVFVHPYPCQKEVEFVATIFGVNKYVNIILAKKLGVKEEMVKRHFKL